MMSQGRKVRVVSPGELQKLLAAGRTFSFASAQPRLAQPSSKPPAHSTFSFVPSQPSSAQPSSQPLAHSTSSFVPSQLSSAQPSSQPLALGTITEPAQIIPAQPTQPLAQSSIKAPVAQWCDADAKVLISTVLKKSACLKGTKNAAFWNEVRDEVGGDYTATQCRTKFFNTNKTRSQKKREAGKSGSAPPIYTALEKFMEDEMLSLKDPVEIPDEEVAHCSSSLQVASSVGVSSDSAGPSSQSPVTTPYRKKSKKAHGSGSRQAGLRNTMQAQWILFLQKSEERRGMRLENEKKKLLVKEENLKQRKEKLAIEKERLKLERQKYEHKKERERKKDEQWRKLIQIEEDRLATLREMRGETNSY